MDPRQQRRTGHAVMVARAHQTQRGGVGEGDALLHLHQDRQRQQVDQRTIALLGFQVGAFDSLVRFHFLLQAGVDLLGLFARAAQRQLDVDTGQHLGDVKWLGDVVDATGGEADQLVFHLAERRHEDDGNRAGASVGLQVARRVVAVHHRHHHVQQDQVRAQEGGPLQRLAAVLRDGHRVAVLLQRVDQQAQIGRRIVNDQDAARGTDAGQVVHTPRPALPSGARCASTSASTALDWKSAASRSSLSMKGR